MTKPRVPGQLGLFVPQSDWQPPRELPDLRGRPLVAFDIETKDEGLARNLGTGWALGPMGYICGVVYAADGVQGYVPVRHPETENFPLENVLRWLDDLFKSGTRIVTHHGGYDFGWMGSFGVDFPISREDTLVASVMTDEGALGGHSLDVCCARAGIPGKDVKLLREAVEACGGDPARPSADLWRLPARYAGPYAEADGVATLGLWRQLEPGLHAQGVWGAYRTEIDLMPMTSAMRRRGVRIDTERALRTAAEFRRRRDLALHEFTRLIVHRRPVTMEDVRSPVWMANIFNAAGIQFPRTPKSGQGSFSKEWMEKHAHALPRLATLAVKYEDAASKFIDTFLLKFSHKGRIHAEINQFLSESGGTRSHRFSYSNPPLQQMTSPDKDPRDPTTKELLVDQAVGTPLRHCFIPEQGEYWLSADYSSQEPRLTVHFAHACNCPGVQPIVDKYIENPRTDYHQAVADMTGLPRPRAKILNLAITYGKGGAATAEEMGLSLEEGKQIIAEYHDMLPYIKPLEDMCRRAASKRGYIKLIDGARMHFSLWEGGYLEYEERRQAMDAGYRLSACSREEAETRASTSGHPWARTGLRRADTRTALNNLIQGSAARQTKIGGLHMWREGITPLLQLHDEWAVSVGDEAKVKRVSDIMINAVKLVVPTVVDAEVGPSWGTAKQSWSQCVDKYGELR
jgi:DNA polymerase I-like protein with 3'-5' exonuclease and polymerase domains